MNDKQSRVRICRKQDHPDPYNLMLPIINTAILRHNEAKLRQQNEQERNSSLPQNSATDEDEL